MEPQSIIRVRNASYQFPANDDDGVDDDDGDGERGEDDESDHPDIAH